MAKHSSEQRSTATGHTPQHSAERRAQQLRTAERIKQATREAELARNELARRQGR